MSHERWQGCLASGASGVAGFPNRAMPAGFPTARDPRTLGNIASGREGTTSGTASLNSYLEVVTDGKLRDITPITSSIVTIVMCISDSARRIPWLWSMNQRM
jgi:hypothetical protein